MIDPDPCMKPVDMELRDLLSGEISLVSQPEDSFKRSCRSILYCSPDIYIPRVSVYNSLTLQPAPLRYVVNHNDYVLLLTDDKIFVHTLDADGYTFTPTIGTDAGNRQYLPSPATCPQRQLTTPLPICPRSQASSAGGRSSIRSRGRASDGC